MRGKDAFLGGSSSLYCEYPIDLNDIIEMVMIVKRSTRGCSWLRFGSHLSTLAHHIDGINLHRTSRRFPTSLPPAAAALWNISPAVRSLCQCLDLISGGVVLVLVPDEPRSAGFLSQKQRVVAVWRTTRNVVGVKTPRYSWPEGLEAVGDVKVWFTLVLELALGIVLGGVTGSMTSLRTDRGSLGFRYCS